MSSFVMFVFSVLIMFKALGWAAITVSVFFSIVTSL